MMEVKLIDKSELYKKAKEAGIHRALEAVGQTAERHAKEQCPVDTGLLRNSITHAVSGEPTAIKTYKAEYGSNRYTKGKNAGKRYRASSQKAGDVKIGFYKGTAPNDPPDHKAVYIGTNVEYAQKQELGDSFHHNSGAAHFMRDSVSGHQEEYKRIIQRNMKG